MFLFLLKVNLIHFTYDKAGGTHMKKIMSFLLCILCLSFFNFHTSYATMPIPQGINYLSLSNLQLRNNQSLEADTIEPIEIIPNQVYTLVFSYDFLGNHSSYIDYLEISIIDYPSNQEQVLNLTEDFSNQRAYLEFSSTASAVHLRKIPMDPTGYDAMLYAGVYQDFTSFVPFYNQAETFEYFGVLPMNFDDPWSLSMIESLITSKDPYGNPLDLSLISDAYSPSLKKPGSYQVIYSSTFAGIIKYYALDIEIYDIEPPVMSLEQSIEIPLTEKVDRSVIVNQINLSDNCDVLDHSMIEVIEDTYTQANLVGNYHLKVRVSDTSSNTTELLIPIEIIDRNAPDVLFPEAIYLYTSDAPLTSSEIISKMQIYDDVDEDNYTTSWVIDQYMQTQLPGKYQMRLSVKDTQLNERLITLYIHVIENKGPIFESNDIILATSTHQAMTHEDIIDWFYQQASSQGLSVSHVRMLFNEYESHEDEEGNYYVYLQYEYMGEEQVARMILQVQPETSSLPWIYIIGSGAFLALGVMVFIIKKKKR